MEKTNYLKKGIAISITLIVIAAAALFAFNNANAANEDEKVVFEDSIIRGGIELQKLDGDTNTNISQGDATLEGAIFTVTNASKNAVNVNGKTYKVGQVVGTITTNQDGYGSINHLPYGTYTVLETTPPIGYDPDPNTYTIQIRENGKIYKLDTDGNIEENVRRGDIYIVKTDADYGTNGNGGQGAGTLAGAQITVENSSNKAIVFEGHSYQPGEIVITLTSNNKGEFSVKDLPFGRYTLREIVAPPGYNVNESWVRTVQVS